MGRAPVKRPMLTKARALLMQNQSICDLNALHRLYGRTCKSKLKYLDSNRPSCRFTGIAQEIITIIAERRDAKKLVAAKIHLKKTILVARLHRMESRRGLRQKYKIKVRD